MLLRNVVIGAIVLVAVFGIFAWRQHMESAVGNAPAPGAEPQAGAPAIPESDGGASTGGQFQVSPGSSREIGMTWDVPKDWLTEIKGEVRLATYVVPGKSGANDGECAVYYFGPGQGGSTEANLTRWRDEFEPLDRSDVGHREVGGVKVTTLDASGTYAGHTMRQEDRSGPSPHWGLLAAIAEGPNGNVFFKLSGPAATVQAARPAFGRMIGSIRRK
jgi:hypothetical protein